MKASEARKITEENRLTKQQIFNNILLKANEGSSLLEIPQQISSDLYYDLVNKEGYEVRYFTDLQGITVTKISW